MDLTSEKLLSGNDIEEIVTIIDDDFLIVIAKWFAARVPRIHENLQKALFMRKLQEITQKAEAVMQRGSVKKVLWKFCEIHREDLSQCFFK